MTSNPTNFLATFARRRPIHFDAVTSGSITWLRDAATANSISTRETTTPPSAELVDAIAQGVTTNEAGGTPQPRPDLRSALAGRARAASDATVLQLMQRAQSQVGVKPRAVPPQPGEGLRGLLGAQPQAGVPRGPFTVPQGGKGGLFKQESIDAANAALKAEGKIDPNNPYAQDRAETRRRMEQLGLPHTSDGARIYIRDLAPEHAAQITRTVGGQTGLAQGADIRTDAPKTNEVSQAERDKRVQEFLKTKPNATVEDLAKSNCVGMVQSVYGIGKPIREATFDAAQKNDGKKTFMNLSWGTSPEGVANQMGRTMLLSEPGTKLHEQMKAALGGQEPKLTREGDRVMIDGEQLKTLKQKLIYPALDKEMKTPEYQKAMKDARAQLEQDLAFARKQNIMVFQSANNEFITAEAAGRPDMATSPTSGVKGLFRVGATNPNGAGTGDDTIAPFSGAGSVDASHSGMNIPVGVDGKGNAVNVAGTSFSSPLMAETAYLVSSANPKLSIDQIERILKDPRVARDIAGTDRDGAGVVDPFAAQLVARNPNITAAQIDAVRVALDKDPNAKFDLLPDGGVRIR